MFTLALVAFDFDGTLVRGDAGVQFAHHMLGKGYFHAFGDGVPRGLLRVARLNANTAYIYARGAVLTARHALGHVDRHDLVAGAYATFAGLDADWVAIELDDYARNVLPKRLRKGIVRQLRHHVEKGDHVVVLSTGVRDLIWPLRQVLGLDFEVVACRLRDRDNVLTGTVEGPLNGAEKSTRLLAIAKRRGHDLKDAWAYSDHHDDAVLLAMVGNPVAVHPTRELARIAKERGWPVAYDR